MRAAAPAGAGILLLLLAQTWLARAQPAAPATRDSVPPARIWHLYHSGWAVETARHLLIFDFVDAAGYDTVSRLATRLLQDAERDRRRTVVFVSHEHRDHYSPAIYGWRKQAPGITYVFGWNLRRSGNRVVLDARADTLVEGIRVRTAESTDLGVGFLVAVDGLRIFHAGDLAEWGESDRARYRREIDWLAAFQPEIDIAFLPIATGATCDALEDIERGADYALMKLRPAVAFPMHVQCTDRLDLYRRYAERAGIYAGRGRVLFAERLAEGFSYDPARRQAARVAPASAPARAPR